MLGFGVCDEKDISNTAAILEWAVSFVFTFYILSFVLDLAPAVRSHHHYSEESVTETANLSAAEGNYMHARGPSSDNTTYAYESQPQMSQQYGVQSAVPPSRNF